MARIIKSTYDSLIQRKANLENQISIAEEKLTEMLGDDITRYKFDSGEGRQEVAVRDAEKQMRLIDKLYGRLESICRRLNGHGLMNITLRRKKYIDVLARYY